MTAPNRNVLWASAIIDELVAAGVEAVCASPGSRSTPLTVGAYEHDDLDVYSILDERSAAFFALGRGRRTGEPTALLCTSGTAAANYHPAVIEAAQARVPLVVLTADRPPELQDSGANQTIDQEKLYGDAVTHYQTLPEPAPEPRALRSVRTAVGRAVLAAKERPGGPVHLNVPFEKPLEPIDVDGDVPPELASESPLAAMGRDGPFVRTAPATRTPDEQAITTIAGALSEADRPLIVAGPADPRDRPWERSLSARLIELADAVDAPLLADPLSGARFGHTPAAVEPGTAPIVCGGYDAYLDPDRTTWPDPDVVVRVGASPTSKSLRKYLAATDARQVLIDPAGGWREAEFTASDLIVGDPIAAVNAIHSTIEADSSSANSPADQTEWLNRFERAEAEHWSLVADAVSSQSFEGAVLATVVDTLPDPATLFVSNSMPVRDLDRFARPSETAVTALANRGASGIDGITSTALGAGSTAEDPLVLVTGDLAYYHDMNGLLSVARCGVDATIVLLNNDGGGIFHKLPIEQFDPPFTEGFKTPHGLDFEPTGDLYGLAYERVADMDELAAACQQSVGSVGGTVIEVMFDAAQSHEVRDELEATLQQRLFE